MDNIVLFIAFRYLRTKNKENFISIISLFSIIGIALGVATLIVVMSVMHGYETKLIEKILGMNGHLSIVKPNNPLDGKDAEYVMHTLGKLKNIAFMASVIQEQAVIITNNKAHGTIVRGMKYEDMQKKPVLNASIVEGDWPKAGYNCAALGISLAKRLNLRIDDSFKLISPMQNFTIAGSMPRTKAYKVCGIFDAGLHEYNANFIFLDMEAAQKFFQYNSAIGEIEIILDDVQTLKKTRKLIKNMLNSQEYSIFDWTMANQSLVMALETERVVMFIILSFMIIIAAFNIISGLIMMVKEKTKHIAILRTLGLSSLQIMAIFTISGSIIGIIGSTIGAIAGMLIASNIESIKIWVEGLTGTTLFNPLVYFLTKLPSDLNYSDVIVIWCLSTALSVLVTVYPSYKASRLKPNDALRYE